MSLNLFLYLKKQFNENSYYVFKHGFMGEYDYLGGNITEDYLEIDGDNHGDHTIKLILNMSYENQGQIKYDYLSFSINSNNCIDNINDSISIEFPFMKNKNSKVVNRHTSKIEKFIDQDQDKHVCFLFKKLLHIKNCDLDCRNNYANKSLIVSGFFRESIKNISSHYEKEIVNIIDEFYTTNHI